LAETHEAEQRDRTLRQDIIVILKGNTLSLKELSKILSVSEKEVESHLEHIRKSVSRSGYVLVVNPAHCKKCGFSFKKREKFGKPGKCPMCRSTQIVPQSFSLKERRK
jgi:predicted Zn-ribbon and HTH transcriptional regulator